MLLKNVKKGLFTVLSMLHSGIIGIAHIASAVIYFGIYITYGLVTLIQLNILIILGITIYRIIKSRVGDKNKKFVGIVKQELLHMIKHLVPRAVGLCGGILIISYVPFMQLDSTGTISLIIFFFFLIEVFYFVMKPKKKLKAGE
ncbi:hypothetical protein [Culicoidibacter larvae]|uniref:Uncharacterized protein n=1 Tax=Culicoidibacter larvae TaxID=2579976 RepID=A0A5R8Q6V9_9FIRM|nr:hypothetical protein [Culicoidibacter larvae]TLG71083.1 hypothetical protein FEZ08_11775 [Culicoidibacter larvae]